MTCAYLAGGCFWCITPFLRLIDGVETVTAGYAGGAEPRPAYAQVKAQQTGHRETVKVCYDPDRVSFGELFSRFLDSVDPFDGGGQYIDRGRSYTLALYYTSLAERDVAAALLRDLEARTGKQPQVSLEPFTTFWPAEPEHQDFDLNHPAELAEEMIASGRSTR